MDQELRELENQLENLSPKVMPADMVSRMLEAMDRWQETVSVEEKVVAFEKVGDVTSKSSGGFNIWATAAAIALMGAVGVILMNPAGDENGDLVAKQTPVEAESGSSAMSRSGGDKNVVQISNSVFDTEVVEEPSQQIVYDGEGNPHRLVRLDLTDRVTLMGKNGEQVVVKKPRVEFYLVPIKVE